MPQLLHLLSVHVPAEGDRELIVETLTECSINMSLCHLAKVVLRELNSRENRL